MAGGDVARVADGRNKPGAIQIQLERPATNTHRRSRTARRQRRRGCTLPAHRRRWLAGNFLRPEARKLPVSTLRAVDRDLILVGMYARQRADSSAVRAARPHSTQVRGALGRSVDTSEVASALVVAAQAAGVLSSLRTLPANSASIATAIPGSCSRSFRKGCRGSLIT
jgi:hypothetical protein